MDKICAIAGDSRVAVELSKIMLNRGYMVYFINKMNKTDLSELIECFSDKNFIFLNHSVTEDFRIPNKPDWIFNLTDYGSESLDTIFNKEEGVKYLHSPAEHLAHYLLKRMED